MIEYRVTKYNPALRDARGAYIADEWTSVADIGCEFNGVVLTDSEYRRVEQTYIDSALAFTLHAVRSFALYRPETAKVERSFGTG